MKIKLSELRKVIREELDSVNESKVGFNDPKVGSWVRFVGRLPEYHDELKMVWDLMISGAYNKDELRKIPSELHRGVRFHALQVNKKAQEGAIYPSWDEVIDELRGLIAQQKAEEEARETERIKDTVVIAGTRVKLAPKDDISNKVYAMKMRLSGVPRADTHELWQAKKGESPEQAIKRLQKMAQGMPGGITIYQDPETKEIFAWAKYNTF